MKKKGINPSDRVQVKLIKADFLNILRESHRIQLKKSNLSAKNREVCFIIPTSFFVCRFYNNNNIDLILFALWKRLVYISGYPINVNEKTKEKAKTKTKIISFKY